MSDGIYRRTPLHCQAKGDTGLTSVCTPDVISLSFFGATVVKKLQFNNNKPIKTKEKIKSSDRGLNLKTRKRY